MISPIEIAAPKNYQDFEMLCLKLWGEIWQIPHEIEFNSDNSQGQNGVDIYGIPKGETSYFGIQCKNKKLNLINGERNRISISDIDEEIGKALKFKPFIKKLIIATSLNKDGKIEEYVRIKTAEHLEKNLFPIQVCFWEFFQRKITEFESISNWYLKNENYLQIKELQITFSKKLEMTFFPKFQKTYNKYLLEPEAKKNRNDKINFKVIRDEVDITNVYPKLIPKQISKNEKIVKNNIFNFITHNKIDWEQSCWFILQIENTGQVVIENYKIELEFEGEFEKIGVESPHFIDIKTFKRNTFEYKDSRDSLVIKPQSNILVQKDSFFSNNIYIKPIKSKATRISLKWKVIAQDFQDSGILKIDVNPKFVIDEKYFYVNDPAKEGQEIEYSLIKRDGTFGINGTQFFDDEKDFIYE